MAAATVARAFAETTARFAHRPFLHVLPETAEAYAIAPCSIIYADALTEIERLSAAYSASGYGHGHRVGLMLENRPAFFLHWFALNLLGASVVPLIPDLRPAELDYLIAHSGMVLALGAAAHVPTLRRAARRIANNPLVAAETGPIPAAPLDAPHAGRKPDQNSECALLYTSGTTGKPKGCVLSNAYFLRTGEWYVSLGGLCALRPGEERLLTPLPLNHANAMAFSDMAMILAGGCIIQLDRFHPRSWWESVRTSGATIMHYLGVMPSLLLGAPVAANERDHAVRFGFGAGVDRRHHAAFEQRFGFPLLEAWAMTETGGGAAAIANAEPRRVGTNCFGRAASSMQARIVDDSGTDCLPDAPGELLVRASGPDPRAGFFTEYLKDPEATQAAWDGGWFHTGDIVRRDADGFFTFVDRKKNIVRRSGENISAAEVESVLRRHPIVAEVAVIAVPDPLREEEVLACVVPRATVPTDRMTEQATALVDSALEELSYFKVPGWVAFLESLPLTASQKVARGEMKQLARTLPGSANCIDTRALKRRRG